MASQLLIAGLYIIGLNYIQNQRIDLWKDVAGFDETTGGDSDG